MKVIAFVDHEIGYRLLQKMLSRELRSKITLMAVVTTKENGTRWWPGIADLARKHALPLLRYPATNSRLRNYGKADYFLLLSWKYVIPEELIAVPRLGVINLHYSLLPKYRGLYPVNWAIINGEAETGISYHWVNSEIDAGPVACQARLRIRAEDTARTLQLRLDDLACATFVVLVDRLHKMAGASRVRTNKATTRGAYFSGEKFARSNEIDLRKKYAARDWINLLRGKSFLPHGENAYFVDPATKRRIYVSLVLRAADK